jgi:NAD(P)-dependent dehydrogenase (short-subunit alcohol dehydrogenase family)
MGQVQGKVAIVTLGASRIGAACAATLAREGAKVIVTDLDDFRRLALCRPKYGHGSRRAGQRPGSDADALDTVSGDTPRPRTDRPRRSCLLPASLT